MNTISPPAILDQLSALGDETRIRILVLLERSEFTVSELCSVMQVPQPTVSRQLGKLAEDGWVAHRADGRSRHYRATGGTDQASRELWRVVRSQIGGEGVYARDAERARGVMAERRRRSAEFFAASAEQWELLRTDLFGSGAERLALFALLESDWVVGDLGTGSGGFASLVAPFVSRVIGVDRSPEMLEAARELLQDVAGVDLRQGELEALPVAAGELDLAVLSLVLHYIVEPGAALAEAHRALRPGGRVVIVDMRAHDRGAAYAEEMGHVWPGFAPDRMTELLAEAGFQDIRITPLPPDAEAAGPLLFLAVARTSRLSEDT